MDIIHMHKENILYEFSPDKNHWLKKERGLSFDEIIAAIENDQLLDVLIHPNQAKYPGQKVYVVNINSYAFLIPFVEEENYIFLKTIIPSRKATKQYLGGEQ